MGIEEGPLVEQNEKRSVRWGEHLRHGKRRSSGNDLNDSGLSERLHYLAVNDFT